MEDTYWQEHITLFTSSFDYYREKPQVVWAKIHTSHEQYSNDHTEIVPIEPRNGERTYVNIHPYVEEPNIIVTVGIPPHGYADTPAIGQVQGSRVDGFRHTKLGNVQAWYYPSDNVLVLWECFFETGFRGQTPLLKDMNMRQLWQHIEKNLHLKFPQAEKVVTPFNDTLFETEEYQAFLRSLGYEPVAQTAYGKLL